MRRIRIFYFALMFVCLAVSCFGDDKSGVSPNTISLPAGPGSIEGLGSSFQPMLNTGSSRYAVKIALPSGVAGTTPSLALQYDSGKGDGPAGIGWTFGPGGISRQTDKGIPRYVDDANSIDDDHDGLVDEPDEIDTFIGPDGEELVQIDADTYRARIEGSFVRYRRVGDYWEVDLKGGTTLQFGKTVEARETDATGQKTFKWFLQKSTSSNGNIIEYTYSGLTGSDNIRYLREIRYGPGASPWSTFYFVRLSYEPKPDWRKDFRSGFLRKTGHRLQQIDIGIQGTTPEQCLAGDWNEDTVADNLIRRYTFTYSDDDTISSQLKTVTRYGADGESYLPPVTFSYSSGSTPEIISAEQVIITSVNAPLSVMDSEYVDLADLNRDGLADILKTDAAGSSHTVYSNLGVTVQGNSEAVTWSDGQAVVADDGLALQLHLAEDRVNLADMDGNGIADLIHTAVSGDVHYYTNKGDFSWSVRKQMSVGDTPPPAPYSSKDITTADLDFDKRIDVIKSTENGYSIWFNLEEGQYSYEVRTDGATRQDQAVLFSSPGVQIADINGDRLSDVAQVTPTAIYYNGGMGHGSFATAVEVQIPDLILTDGQNGQVSKAKLTDINGDGLADLVIEGAAVNQLWFWLNLGTDTLTSRHILTNMPSKANPDTAVRWADINGNGTTDLIYADSMNTERLQSIDIGELISGSAHPNLMTGIDNGLGVQTLIEYQSSTHFYLTAMEDGAPWQTTVPFPLQIVSAVTTSTGLDLDTTPGHDQYVKKYIYRDGFYEDREKQFRGFAEVKVIEEGDASAPTGVTIHEFFTGGPDGVDNDGDSAVDEISSEYHREEDALKGLVLSVQTETEGGQIFSRSENSWHVKTLLTGTTGTEIRFAYNSQTDSITTEKIGSPETMRTTYSYDDYGNVTEEKNYGALSITEGDEIFSFTEYINDATNWLLGLPERSYVTDATLQKVSETFNYYDGDAFIGLPLGQATRGNLTRRRQWVDTTNYIDSLRNEYDSYGNVITTLDPNGSSRSIVWDTTLNVFPIQENIEVGSPSPDLSISAVYNYGLGVLTSSYDFNGNQVDYGYDVFGRPTSVVHPGDSSFYPTEMFAYTMADPVHNLLYSYNAAGSLTLTTEPVVASSVAVRKREVSGQSGTFDTVQYVDGLGRSLAAVSEGEQDFIVSGAVLFNDRGAPQYSFLPYNSPTTDYSTPVLSTIHSESRYDASGRLVELINPPDDDAVVTSVTTQYLPLEKTVIDANNNAKNAYYDGLSRLTKVQENNLSDSYLTTYTYDTVGNLTGFVDAQNNSKSMVYDRLGRKTSMEDPNKGYMEYEYDPVGNLVRTLDNKGQETTFAYDGVNRILTADYLDAAGITPDIAYHYDTASPEYPYVTNVKGRLAWLEDLSGGSFYSYDSRGNSESMVTRLTDGGTNMDFMSRSETDAMGRVTAAIFPDGDRVVYSYNNGGLLENIPGFVNNIDYNASGQRSSFEFDNNITSTYTYDPRLRLSHMVTTDTLKGDSLQDLTYTLDGVGNITEIRDNRILPGSSPRDNSQIFGYDDLYRLTSAQGTGYGSISYQYDKIGNMIFKSSPNAPDASHIVDPLINLGVMDYGGSAGASSRGLRLPGEPPGPHAVTSTASGFTYTYDDNGNMVTRGTDTDIDSYEWDFSNRLTRVTTTDSVSDFIYNASGKRKIKKTDTSGNVVTDYYVTSNYEIRDGKPVKYVFDGARRISRIEGRLTSGGQQAGQVFSLESGWNTIGLDIEPDKPDISTVLASIVGNYSEVWTFDTAIQKYLGHVPSQGINNLNELHGGRGYLVKITTPCLLYVLGSRVTSPIDLTVGWNLVPSPSDTNDSVTTVLNAIDGIYRSVWGYDQATGEWQVFQPDVPAFLNSLDVMRPGRSYWINMKEGYKLDFTQQPPNKQFYHTDHLGSSSLVTDVSGNVVEETTYYPFGRPRYQEQNGFDSAYKFTGKELDKATGLMYYEARYYDSVVSRFISVDPLYAEVGSMGNEQLGKFLANPQLKNLYAYTRNNPINMIDPTGLEPSSIEDLIESNTRIHARAKVYRDLVEKQQVKTNNSLFNWGEQWRHYGKEKGRKIGLEQTPATLQANSIALGSGEMAGSPTKKGPTKYRAGLSHHSNKIGDPSNFINMAGSLVGLEEVKSARNNTAEEAALARHSAGPGYQMQKLEDERVAEANLDAATGDFETQNSRLKGYKEDSAQADAASKAAPKVVATSGGDIVTDSTGETVVWNKEGSSGYILNPDGSNGGLVVR